MYDTIMSSFNFNGTLTSDCSNGYAGEIDEYDMIKADRVRKVMFPEFSIDSGFEEHDDIIDIPTTSLVVQLGTPALYLKDSIIELLCLRDGVEVTTKAIPELIALLSDRDPDVVSRAAHMVYLLSREEKFIGTLATNNKLIRALLDAAACTEDGNTKREIAAAISHISDHSEGRMHIFRSGGIPELVRMLTWPIEQVVHYAVTTLHNLLLYLESSKQEILSCGGLEALTPHLRSSNVKLQALVADSIYFLVLDRPYTKQLFLSLQGPVALIDILKTPTNYTKLYATVIRVIRSISTCPLTKTALIQLGALETLHYHLVKSSIDVKRQLAILNGMRNLSDVATSLDNLKELIMDLLSLIEASFNEEVVACASGILSNLTCNNTLNKHTVCASGGVKLLSQILNRFPNIEDVTEPVLCTLRHCTARHSLATEAQKEVRIGNAFPIILSLLATRRAPIVKAALGLLRNCALLQENLQSMLKEVTEDGENIVVIAVEVLSRSGMQLRMDFTAMEDGVSQMEMVEGSVSALHQLATNHDVAVFLLESPQIISLLGDLVSMEQINNNDDDLMMRELMGLFYQLTKSPEGARIIERIGPMGIFKEALRSRHKSVSTYAYGVIKNIELETGDYQNYRNYEQHNISSNMIPPPAPGSDYGGWIHDGLEPELFNEMYHSSSITDIKHESNATNSWFDTDL
ncbi:Armadillo segment polarity protein [Strongyloides ratti]|uniref:Armadillo segment polarity protein n=1 Tax=Strongyloides ratti TaxID=34506 RepID=A0A090MXN2_STRRB|nr:Armadillo segment polarity protein [Strongyloides ratti]CEF65729.1 Armadillo segment polarity protein [Strongyloides ratti]